MVQDGLYSTNANGTETYLDGMQAGANELTREDYEAAAHRDAGKQHAQSHHPL